MSEKVIETEEYENLTEEEKIYLDKEVDKYEEDINKLKEFIINNNLENNINKGKPTKFIPEIIVALKMYILDSTPINIPNYIFNHVYLDELKLISMFWFNLEDKLNRKDTIKFIQNNKLLYDKIPNFYLKYLCIIIKNHILDSLPPELSKSYQDEYYNRVIKSVNDSHFYQKDNFNSTDLFGDYSLPGNLFIELNILNKIIDNIQKYK